MLEEVRKFVTVTDQDLKKEVILKKKDSIFYLLLNKKANAFTHEFVRCIEEKLDQIQASEGDACLITISLQKLFSGGLDLKYISNLKHPYDAKFFILQFINLLGRFASLQIPSIVVVNGAAVAGGCMLSFVHDFIYVKEKGLFACNQVDIGLPIPPGMNEALKRKHNSYKTYRDMALFGKKFSEKQALNQGIIDGIVNNLDEVVQKATQIAPYGCNRINFKKLKAQTNKTVIDACFNKQHGVGVVGYTKLAIMPKL